MKRVAKPVFFIVAILIIALAVTSVFGVTTQHGDILTTRIKGVSDIRWGIDIKGGVEATFQPADGVTATEEQLEAAKSVIETRMVSNNITDYELYADQSANKIIVRFPWKEETTNYDPYEAIEEISTKHIGNLAREITAVIYGEGTKNTTQVGTRMRSEYFALMDSPFRTWAASLKKDSKRDTYEAWTNTMCNIAMTVANNEIDRQETQMFQYKTGKKGKHTMLNALNLYTAMVAKYRLKEGDDTANGK